MTRWRIAPAVLTAAGMLLAAVPVEAQAAARTETGARPWADGAFPEGNATLRDAARVGPRTTWAVGYRKYGEGKQGYRRPVIFTREDGSTLWSELPAPDGLAAIRTVTGSPTGTTWLTDTAPRDGGGVVTARHDSTGWRIEEGPLPEGSLSGGFNGLAPVADDDVWAVGWSQPTDYLTFLGLIEHWDGTRWQRVPTPAVDSDYWTLDDVVATGPDDAWATGSIGTPEGRIRPLMLHYDGVAWTVVPTPGLSSHYGAFADLAARGPNDVWAVGTEEAGADAEAHAAIAHFDGHGWKKVYTGAGEGRLTSVTATPWGVTAVGHSDAGGTSYRPFGVRRTAGRWKPLAIPAGEGALGRTPIDVLGAGRTLTVVGIEPREDEATGESLPPEPFSLTSR
ncbi:hypothetical protein [Streptomyces sp. NPDC060198]|uniref:hypothetical protein n=1 Tax=Streptomyces sp. NPDC060198 TaxID=3347070 RepID=UPI0036555D7E